MQTGVAPSHDPVTSDVLVIGAGPAGLVGALYLARYCRSVVVVDGGASRAAKIPRSRNAPGFPIGIPGRHLLARLRRQAVANGVVITSGTIEALGRDSDRLFVARACGPHPRSWISRSVLLATGMTDIPLKVPLPESATRRGIVRWCPICDGFEAMDQRILVVGDAGDGAEHALFVRTYTRELTLLLPAGAELDVEDACKLQQAGVRVVLGTPTRFRVLVQGGELALETGERLVFDVIYPMLGSVPQVSLGTDLGARIGNDGRLEVDRCQASSIPGLYAAGDAVSSLNQIATAMSQGAVAATAIHHRLDSNFR